MEKFHKTVGDAEALKARLVERFSVLNTASGADPGVNPVRQLALELTQSLESGDSFFSSMEDLLQLISAQSLERRARNLRDYIGDVDPSANLGALKVLFDGLTKKRNGKPVPFEEFKQIVENPVFGIVLTAHPTFGLRRDLRRAMCELAAGETAGGAPLDDEACEERISLARALEHGPDRPVTLDMEHDQAEEAISAIQKSLSTAVTSLINSAAQAYPDEWRQLRPRLLTVASWVGYDIDGRTDIGWMSMMRKRVQVRREQLSRYLTELRAIAESTPVEDPAFDHVAAAQRVLEAALSSAEREAPLFDIDSDDTESLKKMAKQLQQGGKQRITSPRRIEEHLENAVNEARNVTLAKRLLALRASIATFGFGTAHVHVRLNALQLHNAIARAIGMEGAPEDPGSRRRYMASLTEEMETLKPVAINWGSLMTERTTARRLFMVVRQILHYADDETPVRFLIAESDTSFTVLAAIYFARLFGVENRIDISPLFETPVAMERGSDIIAELLDNPHYRTYIEGRGRLCIQTGFSDAGRYLGQPAASLAVERLHIKLAKLLETRGIKNVEVVIFDTHGESIGRGAHPSSLSHRFSHLASPASRASYRQAGIPLKQEISFQGGDGYCFFATPRLAFATIRQILAHALTPPPLKVTDPFYSDPDHTLEFFLTITRFHEMLMEDPDYGALVGAFGVNMIPPMGSRNVKRQHEVSRGIDRTHPSQIRAIPHNAILHQIGWLANTVGGVGTAIERNRAWFTDICPKSDRMKQIIKMVSHAAGLGSIEVMLAYSRLFAPNYWLSLAVAEAPSSSRDRLRSLAQFLDDHRQHERMSRIARLLIQDYIDFQEGVGALEDKADEVTAKHEEEKIQDIILLHAIRISAIQQLFLLAARIPRFSNRMDFTREDAVQHILMLDVPDTVHELRRVFPAEPDMFDASDFGEPATYDHDGTQGYAVEHERIFNPMEQYFSLIQRVSTAIAYNVGAHG